MNASEQNIRLTGVFRDPLFREFGIMLRVATLLLITNVAHSAYVIGFEQGLSSGFNTFTISGGPNFLILLRVCITAGLFACTVGLALRKSPGVFASMLGLMWVFLAYAWWRRKTLMLLRSAEVIDNSETHLLDLPLLAGLWGATWWDLLMLAAAAILFIWQAVVLIRVARSPAGRFGSGGFK